MHFSAAIPIVVARPLSPVGGMVDRRMRTPAVIHPSVPAPFIRVEGAVRAGGGLDQRAEGRRVTMPQHPQPHLTTLSPDHPANWRAVSIPAAVSTSLVRASPGWITRVRMHASFLARVDIDFIGLRDLIIERRGGKGAVGAVLGWRVGVASDDCGQC